MSGKIVHVLIIISALGYDYFEKWIRRYWL